MVLILTGASSFQVVMIKGPENKEMPEAASNTQKPTCSHARTALFQRGVRKPFSWFSIKVYKKLRKKEKNQCLSDKSFSDLELCHSIVLQYGKAPLACHWKVRLEIWGAGCIARIEIIDI